MGNPTHSEVAKRAYEIWEKEGRPHGRDREYWARAEKELAGKPANVPAPRTMGTSPALPTAPSSLPRKKPRPRKRT